MAEMEPRIFGPLWYTYIQSICIMHLSIWILHLPKKFNAQKILKKGRGPTTYFGMPILEYDTFMKITILEYENLYFRIAIP